MENYITDLPRVHSVAKPLFSNSEIRELNQKILGLLSGKNHSHEQKKIANIFYGHHQQFLEIVHRILLTGNQVVQSEGTQNIADLNYIKRYLIKPTSDKCNLRCSYCYEAGKTFTASDKIMSEELLEETVKQIFDQSKTEATFLWHGGEPLLAGIPFYEKALVFQDKYNIRSLPITNAIQTNGTLLNNEWYRFIKQHDFKLSISFDGPADIHDRYRFNAGSKGTYHVLASKFADLHEHAIPFHIIMVINSEHAGRAGNVYEEIVMHNIQSFDIHPNFQDINHHVHPALFSDFAIELYECWKADLEPRFFHLVDDFFRFLATGRQDSCYFSGRCTEIVAIDGGGEFIPCTRPFDKNAYTFGNITNDTIANITSNKNYRQFLDGDRSAIENVKPCKWGSACNNGCPQHRQINGNASIGGQSVFCNCNQPKSGGYFSLWEHLFGSVSNLVK